MMKRDYNDRNQETENHQHSVQASMTLNAETEHEVTDTEVMYFAISTQYTYV